MSRGDDGQGLPAGSDWRHRVTHWEAELRSQLAWLEEFRRRADAIQGGQKAFDFGPGEPGADAQGSARVGG